MVTFIAFIVTLGILITVHEYGHFQVGALVWCQSVASLSVLVSRSIVKNLAKTGTEFVLAVLPLGGYVKMLDGARSAG